MTDIKKKSSRYIWMGLLIASLVAMVTYAAGSMIAPDYGGLPLDVMIAFCFFMMVCTAEACVWQRVALRSPESMPTFFTAVAGCRMLLALVVMLVYYLVKGRGAMLPFFVVFMVHYVAQLVHHSMFFAKTTVPVQKD